MFLRTERGAYLLSGSANGSASAGAVIDARYARNFGYMQYVTPTQSAVFTLQAAVDSTGWMAIGTYSASNTTASAQMTGFYPYVRAQVNAIYSGGGNTGFPVVHYTPGGG